ncbi:MAG: hypothetical protein COV44_04420 [Deltaproteobacteria bacterium CG11_big_fil_rev_8_21_14_0_20_45_16]|nr:MAG: hypothetical protein COV44_04420 [Deltaproteobacteria bacterium CG11_big_fil_rev_8_21_14_0_20_45_16]
MIWLILSLMLTQERALTENPMILAGPGILRPFYPPSESEKEIKVEAFELQQHAVTNAEFLKFVMEKPKWRRDKVSPLFVDSTYLSLWESPTRLGKQISPKQPVVFVSWFAAKAYCESIGARLPTHFEWELAAAASEAQADSRSDMTWRQKILDWYGKPAPERLPNVMGNKPNFWGLYDLHGLIWEWVQDFNSILLSSDSREAGKLDQAKFCGAGAIGASETDDYPSFMRLGFLSSLEAAYTTKTLGFRCAKDRMKGK